MATTFELRSFKDALRRPESLAEGFGSVVAQGMTLLGLTDAEVAREFDMSRPSVNRWRNGNAAPHPRLRKQVIAYLARKAERVLQNYESEDDSPRLASTSVPPEAAYYVAKGR